MRQLGKSISFDICWRWAEAWGAGDTVMRDGWTAVAPTFTSTAVKNPSNTCQP